MANRDAPIGLKPIRYRNGTPWNGAVGIYYVYATATGAIFYGDAVVTDGTADILGKFPCVASYATGGGNLRGVAVGFGETPGAADLDGRTLSRNHRPTLTEMYVAVVDDPNVVFEIQEDSTGAAMLITAVGANCDLTTGTGSSTTGLSAMELDSSLSTTGSATQQLRILGIVDREDNVLGDQCKWEVYINEHEFTSTTGT